MEPTRFNHPAHNMAATPRAIARTAPLYIKKTPAGRWRFALTAALYIAAAFMFLLALSGCHPMERVKEPFKIFPDDRDIAADVSVVEHAVTRDTTFTIGGKEVKALEVARIFPTDYSDVYYSIRVFPLATPSGVNTVLSKLISEDFATVAGGDISYNRADNTAKGVMAQVDFYGKVFNDTILPQLKESVVNGFYVNTDMRPVEISGDGDIYTCAVYHESCTGGAPCEIDCFYVSISQTLKRELTFEDLVPVNKRHAVREALLAQIAKEKGMSPEDALRWVSDWIAPDMPGCLTVDTFPICRCAAYGHRLVFSYPQGSIAPMAEGCPLYFV